MKPELESLIQIEVPLGGDLETVFNKKYLSPFNDDVVAFAVALSKKLLSDSLTKKMPELVALAFWMRKKNIFDLKDDFQRRSENYLLPRGLAFHIVPSNVDTIFIYSLFLSMFCGNSNIVRLSSKFNPQVEALVRILNECVVEFPSLAERMILIRYDHNDEITSFYSQHCDLRMIWGGDETIRRIRKFSLSPGAKELTFADRFSLAVLKVDEYLAHDEKDKLVSSFYNDSYWFNQMACSSPRLVCWVGGNASDSLNARDDFWSRLQKLIAIREPDIAAAALMDKYLTQCRYAIETKDTAMEVASNNYLARVYFADAVDINRELHCGNGLFLELDIDSLSDLTNILVKKDQTITAFGFSLEELAQFIKEQLPTGVDRIVPFGEALAFSTVWDGYDLLFEMTRSVTIKT